MPAIADRAASSRAARRARTCLAAGALLCAAAAVLFLPRAVPGADPTRPGLRAVLVDASGSAVRTRSGWSRLVARSLREECAAAAAAGEELLVTVFGAEVRVHFPPGDPSVLARRLSGASAASLDLGLAPAAEGASDLAGAVDLAGRALREPGRAPGRVVVLGDGSATGTDPGPRLAALVEDGFGLSWRELPPPDRADLALEDLVLPPRAPAGTPLAARVRVAWAPGDSLPGALRPTLVARVRSARLPDGAQEAPPSEHALEPPAGLVPDADGRLRWTTRLALPAQPAGLQRLELEARLVDETGRVRPDPVPENDRLGGDVRVGDEREVAVLVAPSLAAELGPLLAAQPFPGIELAPTSIEELDERLPQVDALWTFDVPPDRLPARELAYFLRDGGGGWFATGGWGFLAGWTDAAPPDPGTGVVPRPSAWLPLRPAEDTSQEREVILLVDGSGSMEGEPFERVRRALLQIVPAALPSDQVTLRFFTDVLGRVEFTSTGRTPEERLAELAPLFEARVPRGGTDIAYSAMQLARGRDDGARPGLVLLLSDGHSSDSGVEPEDARAALAEARLDLRLLAIGERPDLGYLERLLLEGETIVDAGDLSDLARLLSLEVNRRRVRIEDGLAIAPTVADPARDSLAREVLAAWRGPGSPASWGSPVGYLRSRPAPAAEVLLRSNREGEPILALQRVGRGATAALALSPGAEWAPSLARRLALFAPLLHALAAGRVEGTPRPRVDLRGDRLGIEDVPLDWPVRVEAEIRPADLAADLGGLERLSSLGRVALLPGAGGPAVDPRRTREAPRPGFLDAAPRGAALTVSLRGPDGTLLEELSARAPGPVEWAPAGAGTTRLAAEERPVGEPRAVVRPRRAHPLAVPALLAGLAILALGAVLVILPGVFGQGMPAPDRR